MVMTTALQRSMFWAVGCQRLVLVVLLSVALLFISFSLLSVPSFVLLLSPISSYVNGPVISTVGNGFMTPSGLLYTNETCQVINHMQNCQRNGRPDKDYENYRWRPSGCELPWFDAIKFLELMTDKTVAFVGDSLARNQIESLLCLLWQPPATTSLQVEEPTYEGSPQVQKWFFRSTHTSIWRIWSAWLVHHHPGPFKSAPEGVEIVHLDVPDESFMEFLQTSDVVVLNSGHWFTKRSAYVLNHTIVGVSTGGLKKLE